MIVALETNMKEMGSVIAALTEEEMVQLEMRGQRL